MNARQSTMPPETSLAANVASKPHREVNYDRILKALDKLPQHEGIASTIASVTTIDSVEVNRRMSELLRDGKVIDTGRYGITPKGCKAKIWKRIYEIVPNIQSSLFS